MKIKVARKGLESEAREAIRQRFWLAKEKYPLGHPKIGLLDPPKPCC